MNGTDISKVYLLSVPLENDYKHTLYFSDESSQSNYFLSKAVKSYDTFSYLRKDNIIQVPDHYDEIYNVNYVMYQNRRYNNKWFYAFVDSVEYINNNTVGVHYHIDVMQTWHFEYAFNQCMIERQHTESDVVGRNTIPENFELGEYEFDHSSEFDYSPCAIVVTAGDYGGNYADGVVVPGLSAKAPLIGRNVPSNDNSPSIIYLSTSSLSI